MTYRKNAFVEPPPKPLPPWSQRLSVHYWFAAMFSWIGALGFFFSGAWRLRSGSLGYGIWYACIGIVLSVAGILYLKTSRTWKRLGK